MKSLPFLLFLLPATAAPLLKNGGFEAKEAAPWECEEGEVIREKEGNRVLRVTPDGGVFALTQGFRWPAGKEKLTLKLRLKADAATPEQPVQLRVRLLDADGNSTIAPTATVKQSGKWIELEWPLDKPDLKVTSLMLESNRGEGTLLLDDVVLE